MKKILAIDLGKFNSEACVLDVGTGEIRFQRLASEKGYVRRVLELERPDVVVFEACSMAGWVHDLCQELGLRAKVANTCGEAWKFKHLKRKTDRDDAERIAHLEAMGQIPEVRVPSPEVRAKRGLIKYRHALIGRRVAVQNEIRALFVTQGIEIPRGHRAWTAQGMNQIQQYAQPLLKCSPSELWRGHLCELLEELEGQLKLQQLVEKKLDEMAKSDPSTQLLETIKGVGRRTAEVVSVYVDDAKRFSSSAEISGYSGLVPRQYQSGEVDRRGRITRRGPALLRKVLVEAAWCMVRYNSWARGIVDRISRGQRTRMKQAIIALARKMLVRMWAMLREGEPWRDPLPSRAA